MIEKIGAAIICYNDPSSVYKLLSSLSIQHRALDQVFLIDNSPLSMNLDPEKYQFKLTYAHFPENLGISGALEHACKWARDNQLQWLWLFDQDSQPDKDALKELTSFIDKNQSSASPIGGVSCEIINQNSNEVISGYQWSGKRFEPINPKGTDDAYECDAAITSGFLLNVNSLGDDELPAKQLFIDGVDFELCLKLRKKNYKIAVIRAAKLFHNLGSPTKVEIPALGLKKTYDHLSPLRIFCICRNYTHLELKYSKLQMRPFVLLYRIKHALYFSLGSILAGNRKIEGISAAIFGTLQGFLNPQSWPKKPPFLN